MTQVYLGSSLTVTGTFTVTSSGALVDPTNVTVKYIENGGTAVEKVYPTDAEIVKDSTGVYHMDIPTTKVGQVKGWMKGSGNLDIIEPFTFEVVNISP